MCPSRLFVLALVAAVSVPLFASDASAQVRRSRGATADSSRVERRSPARTVERSSSTGETTRETRGRSVERSSAAGGDRDRSKDRGRDVRPQSPQVAPPRDRTPPRAPTGARARTQGSSDVRGDVRGDDRRDDREWYDDDRRYVPPRPQPRVDVAWPWEYRYRRNWAPRYVYRQVVYVESGWRHRHYDARVDVRTVYRHHVRHATRNRAVIDIYIDRIELYDGRYYLGEVDRIPGDLGRIRATVYRNGRVRFDRDVFLVGDPRVGFELVSTRHYDGFVLDFFDRRHGYRAGRLDLRRERVVPVRYSRLFDPYDFQGYVPISLLPEDDGWLFDHGPRSVTGHYYGDDDYHYYGRGDHEERGDSGAYRRERSVAPLHRSGEREFRSDRTGAEILLRREAEVERIE